MFRMQLAELLHKSISEINDLPVWELPLWAAYFELREESQGSVAD